MRACGPAFTRTEGRLAVMTSLVLAALAAGALLLVLPGRAHAQTQPSAAEPPPTAACMPLRRGAMPRRSTA